MRRWLGRILLAAILLVVLSAVGLPLGWGALVARMLIQLYVIGGLLLLFWLLVRRFLWRIRTKLIVSYLFIAVVPLVLLTLFFFLADLVLLTLVSGHLVTSEIDRFGHDLQTVARQTIEDLPPEGPPASLKLALERAREIHPNVTYALVRRGKALSASGSAPRAIPAWWKGPGFAGLVSAGETSVLRAIWQSGENFLVFDAPVDAQLFDAFEKRTTVHVVFTRKTKSGSGWKAQEPAERDAESDDSAASPRPQITVRVGSSSDREEVAEGKESRGVLESWAFVDRTNWQTGGSETDVIQYTYRPLELIRRLSPGSFNYADTVVRVLTAMGIGFLVVYSIALVFGFMLARSITKSVHALSQGTERLRQGDFSRPIPIHGQDQLGELAESFNMMSRGIQDLLREQAEKQRLEEELRIARQIQMSLLPAETVGLPGIRIAALCLPANEVGGDYYDLLPLSATRMGVLVADVSGKGTSAALYMAELKGLVLSLSRTCQGPSELLKQANRILSATLDPRSFITMTYAVVDTEARTMRYARAGHNPILHLKVSDGRTRVLAPAGLGLGIDPGEQFDLVLEEAEVALVPGDIFVFFTDGLSEAMNVSAELFGEQRLRDVIETPDSYGGDETALKERILAEVKRFVGEAAQNDDLTMVILKVV